MEAVLNDPSVDTVIPILMLTKDTGIPSLRLLSSNWRRRFPEKPILVTFSGDKHYMEECKAFVEPSGVPTFLEIEQPFEVLSILHRCRLSMNRP